MSHYITHTVQKGDTLWEIAKKYHISLEELKALNNLSTNTIYPNQTLKIKKELYVLYNDIIQIGTFKTESSALEEGWKHYNKGLINTYVQFPSGEKYYFKDNRNDNPKRKQYGLLNSILGTNEASLNQMIKFVQNKNKSFNKQIAVAFWEVSKKYGVRGDVAFCQSILETNYFRYGGDVDQQQFNFAGIGATGGVKGHFFRNIDEGVTAQIQHLYGYACKAPLPPGEKLIDPRFHHLQRGSAPYWEDLAGKWAYPGYDPNRYKNLEEAMQAEASYGQKIIKLFKQLKETKVEANSFTETDWKLEAIHWMYDEGILTDESWKENPEKPLPLWAEAIVLKRLYEKMKKD